MDHDTLWGGRIWECDPEETRGYEGGSGLRPAGNCPVLARWRALDHATDAPQTHHMASGTRMPEFRVGFVCGHARQGNGVFHGTSRTIHLLTQ
jgi:hypothetical protein